MSVSGLFRRRASADFSKKHNNHVLSVPINSQGEVRMTKRRVTMPAILLVALMSAQMAYAQQIAQEPNLNPIDVLSPGHHGAVPAKLAQLYERQASPINQQSQRALSREAKLEARRAQRNEMFKKIDESDRKRRESNVALSETFMLGDAPYWMQRAEQCQAIILKAKGIPEKEKYKNPEMVASIADEAMECLWSLESDLRSKGELTRLESCFAETFEQLPPRAKAESQHGVLGGGEYVIIGGKLANRTNRNVKNEYGIQNRPLIYLDTMWRATAEPQSALSYTQLYKMLFFDVGVPKRELNKAEIAHYQREKAMAEKRYSPAILDRANENLRRMAGPGGDAAESREQTRSRLEKFSECTPLGPMLGKPLSLIQRKSGWTFAAANSIFEKRTEKKRTKIRDDYEKRMAEIREARLQKWRKQLEVGSITNAGRIADFSKDRKQALVENGYCANWKSEWVEPDDDELLGEWVHECIEEKVTSRTWKNINELHF